MQPTLFNMKSWASLKKDKCMNGHLIRTNIEEKQVKSKPKRRAGTGIFNAKGTQPITNKRTKKGQKKGPFKCSPDPIDGLLNEDDEFDRIISESQWLSSLQSKLNLNRDDGDQSITIINDLMREQIKWGFISFDIMNRNSRHKQKAKYEDIVIGDMELIESDLGMEMSDLEGNDEIIDGIDEDKDDEIIDMPKPDGDEEKINELSEPNHESEKDANYDDLLMDDDEFDAILSTHDLGVKKEIQEPGLEESIKIEEEFNENPDFICKNEPKINENWQKSESILDDIWELDIEFNSSDNDRGKDSFKETIELKVHVKEDVHDVHDQDIKDISSIFSSPLTSMNESTIQYKPKNGKKKNDARNFLLTQCAVDERLLSDEEGEQHLNGSYDESFIDDKEEPSSEDSPKTGKKVDMKRVYLKSIISPLVGRSDKYKLNYNYDRNLDVFSQAPTAYEKADYLNDSFCVPDDYIEYGKVSKDPNWRTGPKKDGKKKEKKKKKRVLIYADSDSD